MGIKLTKNEQKKQKDALKQFQRYLPTLQLKQQQLQAVIRECEAEIKRLKAEQEKARGALSSWIAVYGENGNFPEEKSISHLAVVDRIEKDRGNIAGVSVPVFRELVFKEIAYDLDEYPLWVDKAVIALRDIAKYDALSQEEKDAMDAVSGATMSLRDAHGDILAAIRAAYDARKAIDVTADQIASMGLGIVSNGRQGPGSDDTRMCRCTA